MIPAREFPIDTTAPHPLREKFLKWQCRVRQIAMRETQGRPNDAVMPEVFLTCEDDSVGQIITVLNKNSSASMIPEMLHIARQTNDPAQVRAQAIQFLSATYYQKHRSFSDILTAVFLPGSPGAAQIREAQACTLVFDAYAQRFTLACRVRQLTRSSPLHAATMAHNRLFNPALPATSTVLAFDPDWHKCSQHNAAGQT